MTKAEIMAAVDAVRDAVDERNLKSEDKVDIVRGTIEYYTLEVLIDIRDKLP